jgi:hypothetical protein
MSNVAFAPARTYIIKSPYGADIGHEGLRKIKRPRLLDGEREEIVGVVGVVGVAPPIDYSPENQNRKQNFQSSWICM